MRTPSRFERDAKIDLAEVRTPDGRPARLRLLGGDSREAENLTAYELGYRFEPAKSFWIDLATFYNVYDDLATIE